MIGKESAFRVADPVFLLDSNILIYVLADAQSKAAQRLSQCPIGTVVTSAIVYAEVMRGIPVEEHQALSRVKRLFDLIHPLAFDVVAADQYARIPIRRGRLDRLVAAHALSRGLTLVISNEADFADIAGLKVENWTI